MKTYLLRKKNSPKRCKKRPSPSSVAFISRNTALPLFYANLLSTNNRLPGPMKKDRKIRGRRSRNKNEVFFSSCYEYFSQTS